MYVEGADPKTGKPVRMECDAKSIEDIRDLLNFDLSEEALKTRLDRLSVSADAKSLLFTIAKATITVGRSIVRIGRKVLDTILSVLEAFPMATTGAIFGAVFGVLIGSVPIIGVVLGPLVSALAVAMGFALGAVQDFSNMALERRFKSAMSEFDGLKAKSA